MRASEAMEKHFEELGEMCVPGILSIISFSFAARTWRFCCLCFCPMRLC
jgi:hypothetical protein